MFFTGVVGHGAALGRLKGLALSRRPGGAYLLSGPKGVGKFKIAECVARYITCLGSKDDTCTCTNCLRYPEVEDVLVFRNQGGSVKSADLDGLSDFFDGRSRFGGPRVLLVDDADRMTPAAANGLLKLLESEAEGWLVLLTSSRPDLIAPTVTSRMQRIHVGSLSREEVKEALSLRGISGGNYDALAGASIYLAESLLSNPEAYSKSLDMSFKFLGYLRSGRQAKILSLLASHEKEHGEVGLLMLAECLLLVINDVLKVRLGASREVTNRRKMESLQEIADAVEDKPLLAVENLLKKSITEYRSGASSPLRYLMVHASAVSVSIMNSAREGAVV